MTTRTLVLNSLRHFRRTHVGVVLGAACATAVLVGALAVGDSVRESLRRRALQRIGRVDATLVAHERFFRADLADRIAADLDGIDLAPALRLPGIASVSGGGARAGIVDVMGIDARFFALSPAGRRDAPARNEAFVNERLAGQLGVGVGEQILVRVDKPSILPRDTVMATVDDYSLALRVTITAVLPTDALADFDLRASQLPPFNVFLHLSQLQDELELPGRANVILAGADGATADVAARADAATRARWSLADAGLEVAILRESSLCELTSDRLFIEDAVADAVRKIAPAQVGVLTWFVDELRMGAASTPYSIVSAIGPLTLSAPPEDAALRALVDLVSPGVGDDGVVLNQWLADDLDAKSDDAVSLIYKVMGQDLKLEDASTALRVRRIVPLEGAASDPGLMPKFPGLHGAESCRDWEPGVPIELKKLRDQDQQYWTDYQGTPKAFLPLATGQKLWGNRFGSLTAIRGAADLAPVLKERLPRTLDPAHIGLFFRDLRGPALAGGTSATDFGGLFLGLSFFIIVAALMLTAMLFGFGVQQRASEIGTLLAVGYRPARVRRLFLLEATMLAVTGAVPGVALGVLYTAIVLEKLGTIWKDALGAAGTIGFHPGPVAIFGGGAIAVVCAVGSIAIALRRAFKTPALALLRSRNGIPADPAVHRSGPGRVSKWCAILSPAVAVALIVGVDSDSGQAALAFFGAGSMLLVGGLAVAWRLILRPTARHRLASLAALGIRNAGRRPGRSLATVALLASGTFLVVSVQAHRLESPGDTDRRTSGTGGFALFGRSTLPVTRDLSTPEGRDAYALDEETLRDVAIVPLRVREGDDASCLNLGKPQNPRLLGVRPEQFADRGAFTFASVVDDAGDLASNPWLLLSAATDADVVPAIGDQASVMWSLKKKTGDTLGYVDERGRTFRVRIVATVTNSILQGSLLVAEHRFEQRFPSTTGYRMFLIDAPAARVDEVASDLTDTMTDIGLELTPTSVRLDAFNAVQNTYLLIFQALGGLGLLLGSVGLGMVVLRNALERRSELAVLAALGYRAGQVRRLLWHEHGGLLALGLLVGIISATVATLPGIGRGALQMGLLVLALAMSGAIWVELAAVAATRGSLQSGLRDE